MGRTLRPLKNKIIVQQDPPKEKIGGLYVPENMRERYENIGTVIGVGGDVTAVTIGERVMFARKPGSAIFERSGDEFENALVLLEDDIVAVVEAESE